jgi:toxin ParE1/3/4
MRRIRYVESAAKDFDDIFDYLANEAGTKVALRVLGRIRARCREMASLPGVLGRARPELRPDIRSFVCGSYVVFFRYHEKVLEVVHVAEGHRDLAALFDEQN